VKELLSQAGVPFTARNVDEDDTAYDELVARGWRTIPVTVIGDRVIKGFDVPALESAIALWRGLP
jgi:glutaredoxin-like protein NrdH